MLLNALLRRPADWRHGYDLMEETGLKSGTLYPLLMRLKDDGWLESEWHPPVPPARAPRHAYRLSSKGRGAAQALISEPKKLVAATIATATT
jgi:PadR family transcriptional regulator